MAEKLTESWQKGVEICKYTCITPIKEKTDVAFILLSSLSKELARKLFMEPVEDIEQAIKLVHEKHGKDFRNYIIPSGNNVLPQINMDNC